MGPKQKRKLIEALLACHCMSSANTRDTIVNDLPDEIRSNIKRDSADRVDVANIVTTCSHYLGGIEDLIDVIHGYEGNSVGMRRVDELMMQFAAEADSSDAEPIDIPFVIVAMDQPQATELMDATVLESPEITEAERERFEAFKGTFPEEQIEDWVSHYADIPENWRPHTYPQSTIRDIVSDVVSMNPSRYRKQTWPLVHPQFHSADFFAEDEDLQERTWHELKRAGCVLIIDAVSLFHPVVRKALSDSSMGSNEHVAMLVLLPVDHSSHPAHRVLESELHLRMRLAFSRFSRHYDKLCEVGGGDLRTLQRWLFAVMPETIANVRRQRPRATNLQQAWSGRPQERRGIHRAIFGPGVRQ